MNFSDVGTAHCSRTVSLFRDVSMDATVKIRCVDKSVQTKLHQFLSSCFQLLSTKDAEHAGIIFSDQTSSRLALPTSRKLEFSSSWGRIATRSGISRCQDFTKVKVVISEGIMCALPRL